jgi:PAS domain S-box-containing protein
MPPAELDIFDVLQTAPVGAMILDDGDNHVLFWNAAMLEIVGNPRGETVARAAGHGFFHDQPGFDAARAHLAATGALRNHATRLWHADGQEAWAAVTMQPVHFDGQSATLIWYFDITDARRREQQLERSQDALLEVLDAAPTGAALTDGPGRICYWNSALLDIFPGRDEEPATAIRNGITLAREAIAAQGPGSTLRIATCDGSERFVAAWIFDVEFEGAPAELIWLHDITELHRAELAAQAASVAKSAFLAMMSHEIRTPMNGVVAIADLLAETGLNDDQMSMIKIIQRSAESLLLVINDILDFSKLESSQLKVEKIAFELDEVLDGVMQLLTPKAAEKGLALRLNRTGTGAALRVGDPLRLRQVLLNLVGNAIKFTAAGSVTIDVDATTESVVFQVIDTGMGIPASKIGKLFTPYEQVDITTARFHGGTGLGLSISKALTELMGGTVGVDSTEGVGSCFHVTLRLIRDRRKTARTPPNAALAAADPTFWQPADPAAAAANAAVILCAEDNATNRTVLARVLDRLGVAYDMAEDGAQALAALDRARHGLILTDGHMPVMDGWELIRTLREAEAEAGLPRLPVLLATADAVSDVSGRAPPGAIDAFLTKPLRRDQLEAAILKALPVLTTLRVPLQSPGPVARAAPAALDLHGLIDLVGDSPDDLRAILADFRTGTLAQNAKLGAALAAGDRQAVRLTAHAIKGAAGYAGATTIAAYAKALEDAAKEGSPLDRMTPQFEALSQTLAGLEADIAASLAAHFG